MKTERVLSDGNKQQAIKPNWGSAVSVPLANVKRVPVAKRPERDAWATDRGPFELAKDGKSLAKSVADTEKNPSSWYGTPRNIYDGLSNVIRNRPLDQAHLRAIADDLDRRAGKTLPFSLHGLSSDVLKRTASALRNIAELSGADFFNFLSGEAAPVNHAALYGHHILAEDEAKERMVDAVWEGQWFDCSST